MKLFPNGVGSFVHACAAGLLAVVVVDNLPNSRSGFGHWIYLGLVAIAFSTLIASLKKSFSKWRNPVADDRFKGEKPSAP